MVCDVKFSLEVDSLLKFIVEEEPFDLVPQGEGGEVRLVDDAEDGFGYGVRYLVDDAWIHQLPLAIVLSHRSGRANVWREPKLAEGRVKETPPLGVVALIKIEGDGDMVMDVDGLQNGGSGRLGRLDLRVKGGVRVVGGGSHGCSSCRSYGERV